MGRHSGRCVRAVAVSSPFGPDTGIAGENNDVVYGDYGGDAVNNRHCHLGEEKAVAQVAGA